MAAWRAKYLNIPWYDNRRINVPSANEYAVDAMVAAIYAGDIGISPLELARVTLDFASFGLYESSARNFWEYFDLLIADFAGTGAGGDAAKVAIEEKFMANVVGSQGALLSIERSADEIGFKVGETSKRAVAWATYLLNWRRRNRG